MSDARGGRRALRGAAFAAVACASLAGGARAADPTPEERLDALVEDLGELDANVRARAAKALRQMGPEVVPGLLQRIPEDVGTRRWEGVLDAIGDLDADAAIAEIQSTRSEWVARAWRRSPATKPPKDDGGRKAKPLPEAPRGQRVVDAILDRIRARRPESARRTVPLERGTLWDASVVPPWVAHPVTGKIPESLAGIDVPVREEAGRLAVDAAKDGKFSTYVAADFGRVIETGPRRSLRPLLVFRRLDAWCAAPAATLSGDLDGTAVEFLDADQDGSFGGAEDLVRFGGGAFRKSGADEAVAWTEDGLVSWRLREGAEGAALDVETEPEPAWRTPGQAQAMATLARWRQRIGLSPQRIDRARSDACRLHHEYWAQNGFSGHDQEKGRPGATPRGAEAGQRSSVGTSPDGAVFVRDISWTILHRQSCVGVSGDGVGAWAGASGSLLWGPRIDVSEREFPILVPGPGNADVPVACEPEIPVPDGDPAYYATRRGAPVAVTWSRLGGRFAELKDLRLELFADGAGDPLPGTLWSKERRYKESFASGFPEESAIFCASEALAPSTRHVARFRAEGREGPVEIVWEFTTGEGGK